MYVILATVANSLYQQEGANSHQDLKLVRDQRHTWNPHLSWTIGKSQELSETVSSCLGKFGTKALNYHIRYKTYIVLY